MSNKNQKTSNKKKNLKQVPGSSASTFDFSDKIIASAVK
jgi:hypothetical protein